MSLSREEAGRRASPVEDGDGGMLRSIGRICWGQIACVLCIFGALLLVEPEALMAKSVMVSGFAIAGALLRLAQVMRERG
jgi:hypothetical protein